MSYCTALRLVCVALAVWIGGVLPASSATRHIVLLFDERVELPGLAALAAEFVQTLASNSSDHIETYRETMDISRFDSDSYRTLLKDYLREKYVNKKIDVAVATFGPSLEFLLKHGDAIFPGTPIVFCGIDRRELGDRSLPPHVHGVLLKREFAPTLELALGLHPDTKHIAVVTGTSEFDTRLLEQARQQFGVYESRLAFRYLTAAPLQKLLVDLAGLPPQTIVLFTTLFQDGAGESFVPHNVVPLVSAAASAPVYGFLDQYVGRGIVGGSVYSVSKQGVEAAKLVLQLLADSERAGPALLEVSGNKVLFDWRQMQRWNIAESRLPPGSEIHFREPTAWQQYRWQLSTAFAIVLLQAAMITWLLLERHRRRALEVESRSRLREIIHLDRVAAVGAMSSSIAHELNQPLGAIMANAEAAEILLAAKPGDNRQVLEILADIRASDQRAADIITHLRGLLKKQSESELQEFDLNDALRAALHMLDPEAKKRGVLVSAHQVQHALPVRVDKVHLEQVIFNLAMNAMDAMQSCAPDARKMTVQTVLGGNFEVEVWVSDSGTGIPNDKLKDVFETFYTTKQQGTGLGLSIVRTIVENCGGKIWAENRPGGGALFRFTLPLAKAHS